MGGAGGAAEGGTVGAGIRGAAAVADPAADAAAAVAAALRGLPQQVPVQYDRLGRELQKWIQCNRCEKWRKVPYGLDDGEIPEEWQVGRWGQGPGACEVQGREVGASRGRACRRMQVQPSGAPQLQHCEKKGLCLGWPWHAILSYLFVFVQC